jgi:hypothetical protein
MSVDDQYTKSLLHFDGADASTTFTDESGNNWARSGNAQISTAQKKFGNSSVLFDGNSYISSSLGSDVLGTYNFTIDFWTYQSSIVGPDTWITSGNRGTTSFNCSAVEPARIAWWVGGGAVLGADGVLSLNQWQHIAFVRQSGVLKAYLNGHLVASGSDTYNYSQTNTYIGSRENGSEYFTGYMDEVRISKGIARWTDDFSVPTAEYNQRLCYLHSRRDRMNMIGISTQNQYNMSSSSN